MSRRPKPQLAQLPAPAVPAVPRQAPKPPASLGTEGRKAWRYLWGLHWLVPERHSQVVTRYCRLQDLLAVAFEQVARDGLMVPGSQRQLRVHPAMAEVRLLSTECRLIETELGLTPAAESKAGVERELPPSRLLEMMRRQREGA